MISIINRQRIKIRLGKKWHVALSYLERFVNYANKTHFEGTDGRTGCRRMQHLLLTDILCDNQGKIRRI